MTVEILLITLHMKTKEMGFAEVARRTGIDRTHLYTILGPYGNPTLDTLVNLCNALGFQLVLVEHFPTA